MRIFNRELRISPAPSFQTAGDAKHCLRDLESPGNSRGKKMLSYLRVLEVLASPSIIVSPLQGFIGGYQFLPWGLRRQAMGCRPSRALGLITANEGLRNAAHCCEPSLYYFAHKGLSHRHQSVHSVKSLENRSCSFPSFRKSAFHLNLRRLRNLRAFHSSFSVLSASLCGKNTNPVHPSHPVICVPSRLLVMDYALW